MFQLKFNNDFTEILIDIPHWKSGEDIPNHIKKNIVDTSNRRVFYEEDTDSFYCGKCLKILNEDFFCSNCNINHKKYNSKDRKLFHNKDITVIDQITTKAKYLLDTTCHYFVFDIKDHNVYLYLIEEEISYDNPFYTDFYKSSKLYVDTSKSYLIEKNGITNLETNVHTLFQTLDQCSKEHEEHPDDFFDKIESFETYNLYDSLGLTEYDAYFYTDNLNDLKTTIYKYSRIWEMDTYLKEQNTYNILQFTLNPLYYPQFEYLVNYKLYSLAWNIPNRFLDGKNFKEIFGLDKKYLPMMTENNIDWLEFEILKIYPTTEIEIIRFFKEWAYGYINLTRELVTIYKVDLKVLRNYFLKRNLSSHYLNEYLDYIQMAKELNLDLKDKKVLYPKNLREAHDELYDQIEITENHEIDGKINSLSNILLLNRYEDDNYVIFPATSIESLIEESKQQKNCVRTYSERIADHECQVYFMRKKEDITRSFVTIEVCNNRISQARLKYNELPDQDIRNILEKWEKSLIQVTKD